MGTDDSPSGSTNVVVARQITVNRDFIQNNYIQSNTGLTRDELQSLVKEAVIQGVATHSRTTEDKVNKLGRELSVTSHALINFFRILGQEAVPYDQLFERLAEIAATHNQMLKRLTTLDEQVPQIAELMHAAAEAINQGDYTKAEQLLYDAEGIEQQRLKAAEERATQANEELQRQRNRVASLHARRAELRVARLDYAGASSFFNDAAEMLDESASSLRLSFLAQRAEALFRLGRDRGDNDAIEEAVTLLRGVLGSLPEGTPRATRGWLRMQLGSALRKLGERQVEPTHLDAAIEAFQAASANLIDQPSDWAVAQLRLGNSLHERGKRQTGTNYFEQAERAYRSALERLDPNTRPATWANIQSGLGNTLTALAERKHSGSNLFQAAIDAYHRALEVVTRQGAPLDWAQTQTNLSNTLLLLGEMEEGNENLQAAEAAAQSALEVWPRQHLPLDWAMAQHNLGAALWTLGLRTDNDTYLQQSIVAYADALEERTCERDPIRWALTQDNLGLAYYELGKRKSDRETLLKSLDCYERALSVRSFDLTPRAWATTQHNKGGTLALLAEIENDPRRLDEAIAAFDSALKVRTRETLPREWAGTRNNLANAVLRRGFQTDRLDLLERGLNSLVEAREVFKDEGMTAQVEVLDGQIPNVAAALGRRFKEENKKSPAPRLVDKAISAYQIARDNFSVEDDPRSLGMVQLELGDLLDHCARRTGSLNALEQAITARRAAIDLSERDKEPLLWAELVNNLGINLSMLGDARSQAAPLKEAVALLRSALIERTREGFPIQWATTQENLGNALAALGKLDSNLDLLYQSLDAYKNALTILNRHNQPWQWASTKHNLANATLLIGMTEQSRAKIATAVELYKEALAARRPYPQACTQTQQSLTSAEALLRDSKEPPTKVLPRRHARGPVRKGALTHTQRRAVDPVRIGILSPFSIDDALTLLKPDGIDVTFYGDLLGGVSDPDLDLPLFLSFMRDQVMNAGTRPISFTVTGELIAPDLAERATMAQLLLGAELIVCWELSTEILEQCADPKLGATLVCPWGAARRPGNDRPFSAAGILGENPSLIPATRDLQSIPPKIVTWGEWQQFRKSWQRSGLIRNNIAAEAPTVSRHTLAVWTTAAVLAHLIAAFPRGYPSSSLVKAMRDVCLPIQQPSEEAISGTIGFLDPYHFGTIERPLYDSNP